MVSAAFSRIYQTNAWNGIESVSGPGSGTAATKKVAEEILLLVKNLGVKSVLNVGCGDDFWMPDLPGYVGIDAAPEAIALARKNHPDRTYMVLPGAHLDETWSADLVICRDAIQHLSLSDGRALMAGIRRVRADWLLLSTYPGRQNRDIVTGAYYEPDLEAPPFSLHGHSDLIFDGYAYEGEGVRDPGKFLGLWPAR